MFGDTTLNCWSISDREPGSWGMKWNVGSFLDEQWLQFGLWGIGASFPRKYNWCHQLCICCDISGTMLMLKAMHDLQNGGKISTFMLPEIFSTLLQCFFSLKTFGKVIKAKALAVHANWQISCTSSKPQQPKLCHRRTDSIFESARHTFSHSPIKMLISKQKFAISKWRRSKGSSQIKSPV